jgi:hypothetical protein
MARGWESKFVEDQMTSTLEAPAGTGYIKEEARHQAELRRTERERQKQALQLQRENILSQKTSNPARRSALAAALAEVEAQISALR